MKKQLKNLSNILFDLQMFADEASNEESNSDSNQSQQSNNDDENKPKNENKGAKTYTQDEVNKIIADRLAREKNKAKQEIDEANKLANMNAQQKIEYERDKLQKELDELKKANALSDMSKQARKMLSDNNISVSDELLSLMVSTEADKTKGTIDSFVKLFNEHVEKEVKERLKGKAPKKGSSEVLTKEKILEIKDPLERKKKIAENINLFSK